MIMMFGNHVRKQLSAYCHDELTADEKRGISEHLQQCRRCRNEYEQIAIGVRLAQQLMPEQAPSSMWSEIERKLRQVDANGRSGSPGAAPKASLFSFPRLAMVCGLVLLLGLGALLIHLRRPVTEPVVNRGTSTSGPAWSVMRLAGQPRIGERPMSETGHLKAGEWLVTDDESRAQISVGEIGEVKVEPNSRIRLVEARDNEHRLGLARGKMQAFIWAPPGQFYVDTPSAVAVDLGCSYTLEVNEDGHGLLRVTLGWVAFEWEGRESFVPADAECVTRPGQGPGTPYFSDASTSFQHALSEFDASKPDDASRGEALTTILAASRKRDALTLWHLLTRSSPGERGRIYDRLTRLMPPPRQATREGIVRGDRAMLDAWWDRLELGNTAWWRMWKGPVPSQTK
jgi:hypothetical protein